MRLSAFLAAVTLATVVAGTASAQTQPQTQTQGQQAASGNDNQAVATTSANAATPAHGANSFTRHEAAHRIARRGFTQVKDLTKDGQGVWHGSATQNGAPVKVWLDYKGNVGTE